MSRPANAQTPMRTSKPTRKKQGALIEKPVGDGATVFIAQSEQYVRLADGRKIPFDEYHEQSRDVIRGIAPRPSPTCWRSG